ncbi:MAG: hypothetical protein ACO3PV_05720 [Pseudohongiellaceae bacterium]
MPRFCSSLFFSVIFASQAFAQHTMPELDQDELEWLGDRIFANECNREARCLTSWNEGEEFPSLGLGHFIWYRAGQQEAFVETFPALLDALVADGVELPAWLVLTDREQPWPDRASFLAAVEGPELSGLRALLQDTMPQQTRFIVTRFATQLDALLATLAADERAVIEPRIARILAEDARHGSYALIDYVHFKGAGTDAGERYAGHGWGLLQVLQAMPEPPGPSLLEDFVHSAEAMLARRVANAPPERDEQRWLAGWNRRLGTYLPGRRVHTGTSTEQ